MRKVFIIFAIVFIFALILIVNYFFDDIDYCLDKGDYWNYQENKCEKQLF